MFSENKKSIFKFHKRGFTLVELIIVITILAVLATIAFVSFQGYTTQSRDATRASTIKAIESGLEIFYTKAGVYPLPDDEYGQCVMTGTTLNHVGYAGDLIIKQINMNEVPVDPLHNSRYIYGVSADQRFFQVAGVFETDIAGTPSLIDRSLAVSSQTTRVKGNYEYPLSYQNQLWPLPSLLFVGTQGATSTGYTVEVSDTMLFITDKGTNLPTSRPQDGDTGKKSVTELLQELTGTSVVLHPVSIPSDMTVKKLKDMDETEFQEKFGDLGVEKKDIARAIYGRKYYDGTSVTSSSSGGGTSSGGGDPDGGSTPPLTQTGMQSYSGKTMVMDYDRKLLWQTHKNDDGTDSGSLNFKSQYSSTLVSYCNDLVLGGFSDWRVPTDKELLSLNPSHIDTDLFSYVSGKQYYYSGASDEDGSIFTFWDYLMPKAHALSGGGGTPIPTTEIYIRCVRDTVPKRCETGVDEIYLYLTGSVGYTWSCKNVGASTVWNGSSNPTDCGTTSQTNCNSGVTWIGDFYQWGRNDPLTGTFINQLEGGYNVGYSGSLTNNSTGNNDMYFCGHSSDWWESETGKSGAQVTRWNTNPQGPCPNGWHVPSMTDWINACTAITGYTCSEDPNQWDSGTQQALRLPNSGYRGYSDGFFLYGRNYVQNLTYYANYGFYWSSTPNDIYGKSLIVGANDKFATYSNTSRSYGFQVRCIKD